jgi:hypothetical protein
MAHYAFLDDNNIVTEVITGRNEDEVVDEITDWEDYYSKVRGQRCVRTSYNTIGNKHLFGKEPFRKNYAGIGYFYDEENDAFIAPKLFDSWVLDFETFLWTAPKKKPDGEYKWNEEELDWVAINGD